jgi:hypothetical protein
MIKNLSYPKLKIRKMFETLTDAALAVLGRDESVVAGAVESTVGVETAAVLAGAGVVALVDVLALVVLGVASQPLWTLARERADVVDTFAAVAAERWDRLALVDVHALSRVQVLEEAVVAVQLVGTVLAGVAPRASHRRAAQLLGAHHAGQLALAHVVADAHEARTRPVVALAPPSRVPVHARAPVRPDATAAVQTWLPANG